MKKLTLLLAGILLGLSAKLMAGQPFTQMGRSEAYSVIFSSVQVSSTPVTITSTASYTFGGQGLKLPGTLGQRTVKIQFFPTTLQGGTSIYWNVGQSTTSIYQTGQLVVLSTQPFGVLPPNGVNVGGNYINELTIESNSNINAMTGVGVGSVKALIMQTKMQP